MSAIPQLRPSTQRPARTTTPPPRLRVVQEAPTRRRTLGFLVLCMTLIAGGLLSGLLLNTQRAQSSFALTDLERQATELRDQRITLEGELSQLSSPGRLAAEAEDLGMVRSPSTAMIRLSDGGVIGVAAVVDGDRTFTVVTTGPAEVDEPVADDADDSDSLRAEPAASGE